MAEHDIDEKAFPTTTPNKWLSNPRTRGWLYGIAVAIGALLVALGLTSSEQVTAILNVVGAVLLIGTGGLALRNTPGK